jgi:AcrR family transcriptional regulator
MLKDECMARAARPKVKGMAIQSDDGGKACASRRIQGERGETSSRLIEAAATEFAECGFEGTDTNKIARRAGFAPQTLYRWFEDKTAIFLVVYSEWVREQLERTTGLLGRNATDIELIDAAMAHHRSYRLFRRSLRQLALTDDRVRQARAESRLQQIDQIKRWLEPVQRSTAEISMFLLEHERLCDAVADGEVRDMGLDDSAASARLEQLYRELRRQGRRNTERQAPK